MASHRQIEANRNNANRSTGPRTTSGKANASRNALRHGLARGADGNDRELPQLAGMLAAALGQRMGSQLCLDIAHSKLELSRIRAVRHAILTEHLASRISGPLERVTALERYERAALARQKRALRSLMDQAG